MAEAFTLETVYTSPRFFGIESATPVQRALCRIAEGLPLGELASFDDVRESVGGAEALAVLEAGSFRPREVDVLSAIRGGKSFFVAAHQFWSAMTARIEHLKAGEVPRHPVLSVNVRSAEATFGILAGTVMARAAMKPLLVGDVGTESLRLRHPSGRVVECSVAAGARAGSNLVSVWLTGAAFEEYARQAGEGSGAVVNYDEQLRAAAGRVIEGGQILSVSSPWAPFGPAYERFQSHFGKPTPERVVIRATGPMMNPAWWTPERCAALERSNQTAYATDVLALFADVSTAMLPSADIKRATRQGPIILRAKEGGRYVAAIDPATRGDRWALAVAEHERRGDGTEIVRIVYSRTWRGTPAQPLRPDVVLEEVATVLRGYSLSEVWTDQLAADFVSVIARRFGLTVNVETITAASKLEMFESLRMRLADGAVELPDDPEVRADLGAVRKIVTRTGVGVELPRTASGHCDTAVAIALCVTKSADDGVPDWVQAMLAEAGRRNAKPGERPPPVEIVYRTLRPGREEARGFLHGKQVGRAYWDPACVETSMVWEVGSTPDFEEDLMADLRRRGAAA